jgi:hypothetical protein
MPIDRLSCASVLLDAYCGSPPSLGLATGFIVRADALVILVTNHHVLSGLHPDTKRPLSPYAVSPDRIVIGLPKLATTGGWRSEVWMLQDAEGRRLWHEHPTAGSAIDIAALALGTDASVRADENASYQRDPGTDMVLSMGSDVSIIGFPEQLATAGLTAIWKGGTLASEPSMDVDRKPFFWVDAAGAPGMSGSPVVARRTGAVAMSDGSMKVFTGPTVDRLLGVYSGRSLRAARAGDAAGADEWRLGRVWKWSKAVEVINHCVEEVKAGRVTPQRGVLGRFDRPDDVRLERCAIGLRAFLSRPVSSAFELSRAAVLQAALTGAMPSGAVTIPRETAISLRDLLTSNPAMEGAAWLLPALVAGLDG